MKVRFVSIVIVVVLFFVSSRPAAADASYGSDSGLGSGGAVAADALVVRPLCFVVMIGGIALFAVTLPISAISRSAGKCANALIVVPARQTFVRKMGDLAALEP